LLKKLIHLRRRIFWGKNDITDDSTSKTKKRPFCFFKLETRKRFCGLGRERKNDGGGKKRESLWEGVMVLPFLCLQGLGGSLKGESL